MPIIAVLGENLAIIFSLIYIYGLLPSALPSLRPWQRRILEGIAFGIFGIFAMSAAFEVGNGFIFDLRNIVILIAAAFGGPVTSFISIVIILCYRFLLGGSGSLTALMSATTALTLGLAFYYYRRGHRVPRQHVWFLVLGASAGVALLLWVIVLGGSTGREFISNLAVPLVVSHTLAAVLFEILLANRNRRVDIENNLRESEERYRAVIASMEEGVIYYTVNSGELHLNPAAERMLGMTSEQLKSNMATGASSVAFGADGSPVSPQHFPTVLALRTGTPQTQQILGFGESEADRRWTIINARPLFRPGETKPYAVVTTFSDITAMKQAQDQIAQERNVLRALIDNTPDFIFIKDKEARFVNSNAANNLIPNVKTAEELRGKTSLDILPAHIGAQFVADDRAVLDTGQPLVNAERISIDARGNERVMLTTKVPLRDHAGNITGLIGISRDITERKQMEQQMLDFSAEQERTRILKRFILDISHDLRTPLSIINTSLYLMGKRIQDPEQFQKYRSNIEEQTKRIQYLLEEILEASALESGDTIYHFEATNIVPLAQARVTELELLAIKKEQNLSFASSVDAAIVKLDRRYMGRALTNVIENALQYTPQGGRIKVGIEVRDHWIMIVVEDNGIGILEADQQHIFDQFFRVDKARSSETGGTGLGLTITRRIVEAHGGSIFVLSRFGEGSKFTIELPLE